MMFSGIIQKIGTVENLESKSGLLEISIASKVNLEVGDSVSIDGCCQTVVEVDKKLFKVQATQETLDKTNFSKLKVGSKVNLESSLRVGEKLDGHLVSGHVDSACEVLEILSSDESKTLTILFPNELRNFIALKGSVAVNGVSLTVIDVKNNKFSFSLIPYTRDNTNLGLLKVGDLVNLEVDLVSRYLINYLENNKNVVQV